MNNQKVIIELHSDKPASDIIELEEVLKYEVKGVLFKLESVPAKVGTMSGNEYLPIIDVILTSGAVATAVKGIFGVLKDFFELKKLENQHLYDKNKVLIKKINKDGVTEEISLSVFTDEERKILIEFLNNKD